MASSNRNQISIIRSGSVQKRQGAWNTVQPGDTYDIKQSMIARLPGDQKQPMGDDIQLVCMLQAVEIERLTQVLNEYKQMYKSLENNELDRHSYEVQIKELAERAFEANKYQSQVTKLKEFIQRQSIELDNAKSKFDESNTNRDSSVEYKNALREIQGYMQNIKQLKHDNQSLKAEVAQSISKYDMLLKNQQSQFEQIRKSEHDIVTREKNREIQQLNFGFGSEKYQLQRELKRLSALLQSKQAELDQFNRKTIEQQRLAQLQDENTNLKNQIQLITRQLDSERRQISYHTSLQRQLRSELQNKSIELNRLFDELNKTRLNYSTLQAQGQSITLERKQMADANIKLQQRVSSLEADYQLLKVKHSQLLNLHEKLHMYEQKLDALSEFPTHLNIQQIRTQSQVHYVNETNLSVKGMERSYHITDNGSASQRGLENETKIRILSTEIERLNNNLHRKVDEVHLLTSEVNTLRQVNEQLKRDTSAWRLRQQSQQFSNTKVTTLEGQMVMYGKEIDRLNDKLRQKVKEMSTLQTNFSQLKSEHQLLKTSQSEHYGIIESSANSVKRLENDKTNISRQLESEQRLRNELQSKYTFLNQDVERLSQSLLLVTQKNELLINEKNAIEQSLQQSNKSLAALQSSVAQLQKEQTANQSLQNRINKLTVENKNLSQEMLSLQDSFRNSSSELLSLTKRNQILESTALDARNMEGRLIAASQQIQRLKVNNHLSEQDLKQSNIKITTELNEYKHRISLMTEQRTMLKQMLDQIKQRHEQQHNNIVKLMAQIEQLRSILMERDNRITFMTHEVERTSLVIRQKQQVVLASTAKQQEVQETIIALQKKFDDIMSGHQRIQADSHHRLQHNSQQMLSLTSEIAHLKGQLTNKMQLQRQGLQQIQRLNVGIRLKVTECQEWKSKFNEVLVRLRELQPKSTVLAQQYEKLQSKYNQAISERQSSAGKITDLETRFTDARQQLEKLNLIIAQMRNENTALRQQLHHTRQLNMEERNRLLLAEIERLCLIIDRQNQEVAELRMRFSDETSLHKRIQEHLALFVILFAEIESLRHSIKDKEREVENVRRHSLTGPYQQ